MYKTPWKVKSPVLKFVINFVIFLILLGITRELYNTFIEQRNLFGINSLIDKIVLLESSIIDRMLNLMTITSSQTNDILTFKNGHALRVLRPCSGVRQLLQVLLIFSILPGPIKPRFWFIPMSMLIIAFAVILHLVILSLFVAYKPDQFTFAHNWLTKTLFYSVLFGVWLFWEEVITQDYGKLSNKG